MFKKHAVYKTKLPKVNHASLQMKHDLISISCHNKMTQDSETQSCYVPLPAFRIHNTRKTVTEKLFIKLSQQRTQAQSAMRQPRSCLRTKYFSSTVNLWSKKYTVKWRWQGLMIVLVFFNTFWKGGEAIFSVNLAFGEREAALSVAPLFWNVPLAPSLIFFLSISLFFLSLSFDLWLVSSVRFFVVAFIVTQFRSLIFQCFFRIFVYQIIPLILLDGELGHRVQSACL